MEEPRRWRSFFKVGPMFEKVNSWWKPVPQSSRFDSRIKPLALLELLFPCTTPTFYASDHWVHYLTDGPVVWIPGHHFPIAVLIWLLRSSTGIKCKSRWFGSQWRGVLCGDIDELSIKSCFFLEYFMSQFKMVKQRWSLVLFSGNAKAFSNISMWNNISAVMVNDNGIHKNGDLTILHILSRHSINLLQRHQISRLQSKLEAFSFCYIRKCNGIFCQWLQKCYITSRATLQWRCDKNPSIGLSLVIE